MTGYSMITGLLPFLSHEAFNNYVPDNKPMNSLFVFNSLGISSLEEYIVYRENYSNLSYKDNVYAIDLPTFGSFERGLTDDEMLGKFKDIFKKVHYL